MVEKADDAFLRALAQAKVEALWLMESSLAPQKRGTTAAAAWRWSDLEPLIAVAASLTNMADIDRRVLSFFREDARLGKDTPTKSLNAALQILLPGEHAKPHRHSMNAIRFVMEGHGGVTIVEGKRCDMSEGDLILTPGGTWHEHVHEGEGRMVWFDALDVPLHRHFDNIDFEPGPARKLAALPSDESFAASGMLPMGATPPAYSPKFRYSWRDAAAALEAMAPNLDGSRSVRYVNPVTGGAVMSLLDCYLMAFPRGEETMPRRSTAGAVCVVAEGEGSSNIGEQKIAWCKRDVFTLPPKSWHTHRSESRNSTLFLVTEQEMLRKLGLLKDEVGEPY